LLDFLESLVFADFKSLPFEDLVEVVGKERENVRLGQSDLPDFLEKEA
jgi:hypothetical protein